MACAYAKFTGRLGVCLATSGPGGIHLLNGLYDAKMDGQPVLAITGLQYHDLIGTFTQQDVGLDRLYMDVAAFNERIMGLTHVENVTDLAVRSALSYRTVSHLTFPVDFQEMEVKSRQRSKRNIRAPLRHINGDAAMLSKGMIDDLLNLARLDRRSMDLKMTSLNSLVENALHDLESETTDRKIDWRVGSLPSVNCDPGLIQQVFANLLSNAVKYTRRRERAVIEIDQSTINGQLVLFVRDNGAGFNPKYSDKLFGTFQRLHTDQEFEGTGVGLATVQRIIRKHGGRIWAEAETNKGATFYFSLGEAAAMCGAVNRHASGK